MAGFAIDMGDAGSSFEQGVAVPSSTATAAGAQGLANLSKGLFGAMDSYAKATSGSDVTEAEMSRKAFGSFVTRLDDLRGVTDPTTLRSRVNSAVSSYESQGYQIGAAEADAIKRRTGIDISASIVNPAIAAADAANKQLMENPAFLYRAEAKLESAGKPYTSQDVAAVALGDMKASEAAATYLVTAKNLDNKAFQETYIPHADKVLEDIRGLAIIGLKVEIGDGDVSPESLLQLRTKFDIAKAQLTKPANITEDAWQHVGSQLTELDNLLTRLETYDAEMLSAQTAAAMEPISAILLEQAKKLGATDPILAQALLSDKVDWSTYVSSKWPDVMGTLRDTKIEDTVYTDLDVFGIESATTAVEEGQEVTTPMLHDEAELDLASDRSPRDRKNAISTALNFKVRLSQPVNIDQPEHRKAFTNGIGQATINIATSPQLVDKKTMDSLFAPEVFEKMAKLKVLDPEAHQIANLQMQDAIQAQADIFSTTMKGTLEGSMFTVTGLGRVELRTENKVMPKAWTSGKVQAKADQYYGGNIYRMIKDGGKALSIPERTELRGEGFHVRELGIKYAEITKANNQFKTYAEYFRKAGGDPSLLEAMILDKQEEVNVAGDAVNTVTSAITSTELDPAPMSPMWTEIGADLNEIYNNIPEGTEYFDPDGNLRTKGGN